ncbi:hypothetical protein NC99_38350 [Sunxiuqinia dokdonensis]|uniref:Uncharacterized protein n=1 Tax=Sunxiuqinia dokdonensis TaxID=1409788 RepID=A0A0L8V4W8_9BACT|nr:hypothetical protein NC99_38350 [Sunxiuqinia dokdonensis]
MFFESANDLIRVECYFVSTIFQIPSWFTDSSQRFNEKIRFVWNKLPNLCNETEISASIH